METKVISEGEKFRKSKQFKECLVELGITEDDFTCNTCGYVGKCEFSWDLYNTNGDCLGMK